VRVKMLGMLSTEVLGAEQERLTSNSAWFTEP